VGQLVRTVPVQGFAFVQSQLNMPYSGKHQLPELKVLVNGRHLR
jgi:hypothetical protein